MGMSLIRRAELAKRDDIIDCAESGEGKSQIQAWSLVSGRPDNAVAGRPVGIAGIMIGYLEIESRGHVHD